MFISTFNKTVLSTLAAAIVATGVSVAPSFAGGGGGGGGDRTSKPKFSTISTTNADGTSTSIRSQNNAKSYTVTRSKNGKLVSKKLVKKQRMPFMTIFNPDGGSRTVTKPSKPRTSATRHLPDGTDHTVTHASNPRTPFITIHNPDGTSHTVGGANR